MAGELVPGHPDQPRYRRIGRARLADRVHGGQERLGREVLGQAGVAAAGQQVAVDVRQRIASYSFSSPSAGSGRTCGVRHTLIVVRAAGTPTGGTNFSPDGRVDPALDVIIESWSLDYNPAPDRCRPRGQPGSR